MNTTLRELSLAHLSVLDGAGTTRAGEFRQGDKQMDRQKEQIPHESNVITPVILRKTARHGSIPSYCEFATHRLNFFVKCKEVTTKESIRRDPAGAR